MEKQIKETKMEIRAIPTPNNGESHTLEVNQTQNKKYMVTLTRGETKIHLNLADLFDMTCQATKEFELIALIKATRDAQKSYFKTRDANYLDRAKQFEKQLDQLIEEIEQPKLF